MPPPALKKFHKSLDNLEKTRKRMKNLYRSNKIINRDADSIYEALFLRAVTSFEGFLEELFFGILRDRSSYRRRGISLRMKVTSAAALQEILLQGNRYLNWLPFDQTERRAKLHLKAGKPFSQLPDHDKSMITKITTIRNAIAHKSKHALSEFERKVIASRNLLPRERVPGGYLRSSVTISPPVDQFEGYILELARISTSLC